MEPWVDRRGGGEKGLDPAPALERIPRVPDVLEGAHQAKAELWFSGFERPVQRGPDVVPLRIDEGVPLRALGLDAEIRALSELEEVLHVPATYRVRLVELLQSQLADGLQHEVPVAADVLEQTHLDERVDRVEIGPGDGLRRRPRERREDAEPREQPLQIRLEQVVAPLDRRPQRPLALRNVSTA